MTRARNSWTRRLIALCLEPGTSAIVFAILWWRGLEKPTETQQEKSVHVVFKEVPVDRTIHRESSERCRFQLVPTQNLCTHILLDTRRGRLLQVNFAVDGDSVRGWQ